MVSYWQELDKCSSCGNENKGFIRLNGVACFQNKVRISFSCGVCNNKWDVLCQLEYVSGGNVIVNTGIGLIAIERQRQIRDEGFTLEHDEKYLKGELAKAAACYAMPAKVRKPYGILYSLWPFERKRWKPSLDNRIKELVKAGALVAAEIDRMLIQMRR